MSRFAAVRLERFVPRLDRLLAGRFCAVDHVKARENAVEVFAAFVFILDKRKKSAKLIIV